MIISLKGNIGGGSTGGGSTTGGDGAQKLVSGQEQSLLDSNKALHVKTIDGESLAGQGDIALATINGKKLTVSGNTNFAKAIVSAGKVTQVTGINGYAYIKAINGESLAGSGNINTGYRITSATTMPSATKEGEMIYLAQDITHKEPVTGVGGKSMEFGETGENEYHIIQYGDADLRINRNGEGTIYRVTSRGQELPFSLDGTWYKLPKSLTNRKDAFYMFGNNGWFWFYVYEGEEFATNDFGGGTYAAGETCDYVDIVVDYEKGQYITKNVESPLYSPKVTQGNIINNVTISFPDSYKSTFESEELMIGFEWYGQHPDLYIGANADYVRYNVPGLDIDMYVYNGESIDAELNDGNWVHIKYEKVGALNTITFNCDRGTMIENPVSRQDDTFGMIQWEEYNFSAKVFVYDDREGADHSEIANALAPYFEAQKTSGQGAVNAMPADYCIIFKGIPFYGPLSEGEGEQLNMYTNTAIFDGGNGFVAKKLYISENGNCNWGNSWAFPDMSKPVYVSKEGLEGFDGATKITFKFNDGFEWGNVLAGKVYIDGWDRDLYIRPANYGEEHRIDVSVQDWFGRDSICDPNYDQGDYGKLVKYETNGYSIYWVAYANLEARTMTIYMKSSHTEDFGFTPDEGLQGQIDANHIEVSIEGGASVATVPTELSYVVEGTSKKVVLPTGGSKPTFNLSINDGWDALVNDDQLQGFINYIKTNGLDSVKDVDVKVYNIGEEGEGDVYIPVEIYASSEGINITISYVDGGNYINVDYDGNTTSFTTAAFVATNPNEYSVFNILQMNQAEYDALENKEGSTLYVIKG